MGIRGGAVYRSNDFVHLIPLSSFFLLPFLLVVPVDLSREA